jgi:hypothetical protein
MSMGSHMEGISRVYKPCTLEYKNFETGTKECPL